MTAIPAIRAMIDATATINNVFDGAAFTSTVSVCPVCSAANAGKERNNTDTSLKLM